MIMVDEDGNSTKLKLRPGLSSKAISDIEEKLPCAIPSHIRELLEFTSGFENGPLDDLDFTGSLSFEYKDMFPHSLAIAGDGFGNFWVIDLMSQSADWGPVFYACHDPAVIVYQADNLESFIKDFLRFANPPHQADLDRVHEEYSMKIWGNNPDVLDYQSCITSPDGSLREFASMLDETFEFIDLRSAKIGDGFSWGKYGPRTVIKRFREEPIFAYQIQKSFWQRLFRK